VRTLAATPPLAPTVAAVAERWFGSRVDWSPNSRTAARGHLNRALPIIGARRVDDVDRDAVADLVAQPAARPRTAPASIKKSIGALAMAFDHAEITPNPFRGKVRLPPADTPELNPPTAAQVEDVLRIVAPRYRLALLVLEATGMRVGELEGLEWRDVDEPRERWKVRKELNHSRRDRWVSAPPDLYLAVTGLVPREDRDPSAPVFPHATQERLRTEIGRACRAAGVPHFSPHDLRHRRVSLWHRQGVPWRDIGEWVGHRKISTTADIYTHVLLDDAEVDPRRFLA